MIIWGFNMANKTSPARAGRTKNEHMKIKQIMPFTLVLSALMFGCSKVYLDINANSNSLPTLGSGFLAQNTSYPRPAYIGF